MKKKRFFSPRGVGYVFPFFLAIPILFSGMVIFLSYAYTQELPFRIQPARNIGKPLNSPYNDFAPSLNPAQDEIYFNRKVTGYTDIYFSQKKDKKWAEPVPVLRINSPYNDETPFITRDGAFLLFASDRDGSITTPPNERGAYGISFDLYITQKTSDGWATAIPLPGDVNTAFHERAPSFGCDGKTLYFTRWPFGKLEDAKIMAATLKNGAFVDVRELPPPINTEYSETVIYPSPRKGIFYFTSNRKGSLGGYDIFRVEYKDGKWGEPQNPGDAINSPYNEAFFSLVGDDIYFSSNRKDSLGGFDIYSSEIESPFIIIRLVDEKTQKPMTGTLSGNMETDKKISLPEVSVPESGYQLEYPGNAEKITFLASAKGYLPEEKSIDLKKWKGEVVSIPLKKTEEGDNKFTVREIHFSSNSDTITEESFVYLNGVASYLRENPDISLKIIGHTDLHGDARYNMELSLRRAKAVKAYLVRKGISAGQLQTMGKGFSEPVEKRKGEPSDSKNRRTEFEILKN